MSQSPPLPPPAAMPSAAPALPPKPGYVQAIAIMCLVSGILNILWGILVAVLLISGCFTVCLAPLGIYPVVLGILEILYALKLLPTPIQPVRPAQYLAIMEIVNIITLDVLSVAVGIISLVFYADPKVKEYFDAVQKKPAA